MNVKERLVLYNSVCFPKRVCVSQKRIYFGERFLRWNWSLMIHDRWERQNHSQFWESERWVPNHWLRAQVSNLGDLRYIQMFCISCVLFTEKLWKLFCLIWPFLNQNKLLFSVCNNIFWWPWTWFHNFHTATYQISLQHIDTRIQNRWESNNGKSE